jgi:hypothetical protein
MKISISGISSLGGQPLPGTGGVSVPADRKASGHLTFGWKPNPRSCWKHAVTKLLGRFTCRRQLTLVHRQKFDHVKRRKPP